MDKTALNIVEDGPAERKPKSLPKVLTSDEVKALMLTPNMRVPTGLRDRAMMQLMHRCGLRLAEACALPLGAVGWDTGHIRVLGKGKKERTVYADPQTLDLLKRWRDERARFTRTRKDDAPLFVSVRTGTRGKQVTVDSAYKSIRRRMLAARIDDRKAHPHTLRHTFATDMLSHGRALIEVQKLMGHSSIATTQIYLHVNDPRLAEEVQAIDWGY